MVSVDNMSFEHDDAQSNCMVCLDSPDSSTLPPPYHSSPLHPPTKRTQPETGHWSSISDRHQHKHQGIMDSPPSSSSEEDIPPHGPKSWLLRFSSSIPVFFSFPTSLTNVCGERPVSLALASSSW